MQGQVLQKIGASFHRVLGKHNVLSSMLTLFFQKAFPVTPFGPTAPTHCPPLLTFLGLLRKIQLLLLLLTTVSGRAFYFSHKHSQVDSLRCSRATRSFDFLGSTFLGSQW